MLSSLKKNLMKNFETIRIESHIPGLEISILHLPAKTITGQLPVLFVHGLSFPSELSFGFRMSGMSWMDDLAQRNFDSYAIDLLGYGSADHYPQITKSQVNGKPPGMADEVYKDVDKAVAYILTKTGANQIILIGHSWGGSVAMLYAEKHPENIAKLTLFAPITLGQATGKPGNITTAYERMTPDERVDAMKDLTPTGETSRLEPEIFKEWKSIWLNSDAKEKKTDPENVYFPAGPLQDLENLQHGISYYDPSKIKCPVLVIRGDWDNYPNDQDALDLLDSMTSSPDKHYVIIGWGTHVLHLEQSRHRLYGEVGNFISDTNGSIGKVFHSIAVIFEVIPNDGKKEEYLNIAAKLNLELKKIDGFISIERFQSLIHPEKILSLSFWRDEKAILAWRNLELHREAQAEGRNGIFKDYHLRIADVVRDYGQFDRKEAPSDSRAYH